MNFILSLIYTPFYDLEYSIVPLCLISWFMFNGEFLLIFVKHSDSWHPFPLWMCDDHSNSYTLRKPLPLTGIDMFNL